MKKSINRLASLISFNKPTSVLVAVLTIGMLLVLWRRFDLSVWFFALVGIWTYWILLTRQKSGWIISIFVSAVVLGTVNIVLYLTCSWLHLSVTPILILLSNVLSATGAWFLGIRPRGFSPITKATLISEIILLLGVLGLSLFLIQPFFSVEPASRVNLLSIGEDNISHFALHHAVLEQGFLSNVKDPGVISGLSGYPQGLHAFYASNTKMLFGNNPSLQEIVNSHILQISLTFSLMVLSLSYFGQKFLVRKNSNVSGFFVSLAILLLILSVSTGIVFYLFTYGFHTQIYSYFLLLLVPIIYDEIENLHWRYVSLAFIFALLCYSWFILVAIQGLYMLAMIAAKQSKLPSLKTIFSILPLVAIGLLAFLNQPAVNDGGNALLLGGAVYPIHNLDMAIVLITGLVMFFVIREQLKTSREQNKLISLALFMACIFIEIVIIGVYQRAKIHHFEYFYYKSLYLPYMILLTFSIVGVINIFSYYLEANLNFKKYLPATYIGLGLLFVVSVIKVTDQPYPHGYIHKTLITAVDQKAVNVIYTSKKEPTDIVYPDTCESYSRYITMRWVGALLLTDNDTRHSYQLLMLNDTSNEMTQYFNEKVQKGAIVLRSVNCNVPGQS